MRPQPRSANVGLVARATAEGALVVVQPLVQLQVHELRELGRAAITRVRLGARVEAHVRLQVGRGAETLLAFGALVRLFTYKTKTVLNPSIKSILKYLVMYLCGPGCAFAGAPAA